MIGDVGMDTSKRRALGFFALGMGSSNGIEFSNGIDEWVGDSSVRIDASMKMDEWMGVSSVGIGE